MDAAVLFEAELESRGVAYRVDVESSRYVLQTPGGTVLVSLDNLSRDLAADPGDGSRVRFFVDSVLRAQSGSDHVGLGGLFWCLEPNDLAGPATIRAAVTPRLDRVLTHVTSDGALLRGVSDSDLSALGTTASDAGSIAWANLAAVARRVTVHVQDLDGVPLLSLETDFVSKASLLLSPDLHELVAGEIGWPIHAVLPDRDFVYLWSAEHTELAARLGPVVVREFRSASYPLSTEVIEIDSDLRALGVFPVG